MQVIFIDHSEEEEAKQRCYNVRDFSLSIIMHLWQLLGKGNRNIPIDIFNQITSLFGQVTRTEKGHIAKAKHNAHTRKYDLNWLCKKAISASKIDPVKEGNQQDIATMLPGTERSYKSSDRAVNRSSTC